MAAWYRHASTLAVATGAVLLVTSGYVLPSLAYATEVGTPPARAALLWAGVLGGLAMWMFVHMYIWPNVQVMHRPAHRRCRGQGASAREGASCSPASISFSPFPSRWPWWRRRISTDVNGGGTAETVAASARAGEPDRYLAALLAPPAAREGLLALAAFSAELGRIGHLVTREPMMGEIRLQWWRDALQPGEAGMRTGNPVADALREAVTRHDLPAPFLLGMIDAHAADLEAEPFPTEAALDAYLAGSEGAQFALAAHVLGGAATPELEAASEAAGRAYGLVRLLFALPQTLAQGRSPLPRERLERAGMTDLAGEADPAKIAALMRDLHAEVLHNFKAARQHVANLPRPLRVAFLPLALVRPYLRALERPGRDSLREIPEIAPLRRIWAIARAHWLGRM